jgi:hypothetical protein
MDSSLWTHSDPGIYTDILCEDIESTSSSCVNGNQGSGVLVLGFDGRQIWAFVHGPDNQPQEKSQL